MKHSYDPEHDVLFISKGVEASDALTVGDVMVEFSDDGEVVALEVMNASDFLSDLSDEEIGREELENLQGADLKVRQRGSEAFVIFRLEIAERTEKFNLNYPAVEA